MFEYPVFCVHRIHQLFLDEYINFICVRIISEFECKLMESPHPKKKKNCFPFEKLKISLIMVS